MKTGICKLCGLSKPLLSKSHIIPEFMYSGFYDEHHRMYMVSSEELPKDHPQLTRPQSGQWECGILCQDCDSGIIGKYEDYARKLLFADKLPDSLKPSRELFNGPDGTVYNIFKNVDYKKFKLFVLSMAWKMGISSRPLFKDVRLGEEAEPLRRMIHEGNPKEPNEFPILLFSWINDKEFSTEYIFHPLKVQDKIGYRFSLPMKGIVYNVYTSFDAVPSGFRSLILQQGQFGLYQIPPGLVKKYLLKHMGK